MGYKHTKTEILDAAIAVSFDDGLSQLSFGRVAKRLGIHDRTVVYYFPSKDDLVGEVLVALGTRLQEALTPVIGVPVADHRALLRLAWPIVARPAADPTFACYFEALGLAAAGREPYRTIVPALVEAWIDWAAATIAGPARRRRAEAETAIAVIDGLLLLRQVAGPDPADRAARRLGIR